MIKLDVIADATNVSVATVSNALSGKGRMRPDKRQEIITKARELGYPIADQPKKQRSSVVLIMAEDLFFVNTDHIVTSACRRAEALGYQSIIINLDIIRKGLGLIPDHESIRQLVESACHGLGVPIVGMVYVAQYVWNITDALPKLPFPVVYAYCQGSDSSVYVNYDDYQGALLATNELMDNGCNTIVTISGPVNTIPMNERMYGYQQALVSRGIAFDPRLVYIGDWYERSGYQMMNEILDSGRQVDGIFAQNDLMATGALRALHDRHINVPGDIAIIGFDDSVVCEACYPKLSSIWLPLEDMGRIAVEKLDDQLRGCLTGNRSIRLPCALVRRETSVRNL